MIKKVFFMLFLPALLIAGTHIMQGDSAGGDLTGTYPSPTLNSPLSLGTVTFSTTAVINVGLIQPNFGDRSLSFVGDYFFFFSQEEEVARIKYSHQGINPGSGSPYGNLVFGGTGINSSSPIDSLTIGANSSNPPTAVITFSSTTGSSTVILSTSGITDNVLSASQFIKTDGNKNFVSYDLLNATQTWTAPQIYASTITVVGIIGNGTPSVSTGTGAGNIGSPTASISGKNNFGQITVNSATTPATSAIVATITPSISMPIKYVCILFPANSITALLTGASMVIVDGSTGTWNITSGTSGLTGSSTYIWDYHCGGY